MKGTQLTINLLAIVIILLIGVVISILVLNAVIKPAPSYASDFGLTIFGHG